MRTTLNIKHSAPEDLARQLRSLAAKIDAATLTPGADLKVGNVRVQVAEVQEADIRAFARERGIPVGTRGRFSKELQEAFAAHQARSQRSKEAAAKRRAAKEAELQEA